MAKAEVRTTIFCNCGRFHSPAEWQACPMAASIPPPPKPAWRYGDWSEDEALLRPGIADSDVNCYHLGRAQKTGPRIPLRPIRTLDAPIWLEAIGGGAAGAIIVLAIRWLLRG